MISVYLQGGLGNFMFQIAACASIAKEHGDEYIICDRGNYIVHKNLDAYKDNIFRKIPIVDYSGEYRVYNEPNFTYDKLIYSENMKLHGYFQSEKYFTDTKFIRELYSPRDTDIEYILDKYYDVFTTTICSIHVRRGDYLKLQEHHPVCDMNYYQKAMKLMPKGCRFLVFSDDIDWCKENFIDGDFIFISGEPDFIDLYMMSICDNNIIANSSFSWWGAWLNKHPNKIVVAPTNWFGPAKNGLSTKDLIPPTWIQI